MPGPLPPTAEDLAAAFYAGRAPSRRRLAAAARPVRRNQPHWVVPYTLVAILLGAVLFLGCTVELLQGEGLEWVLLPLTSGLLLGGYGVLCGRRWGWWVAVVGLAYYTAFVILDLADGPESATFGVFIVLAVFGLATIGPLYRRSLLDWCGVEDRSVLRSTFVWLAVVAFALWYS